ncbi:MAG TPA: putative sulfate/molybdate transporter [Casimicrobiaceae bacterium]|nr:putative sulfate/molybdate transporter [Casimicrobiaceae bacterium]
MPANRFDRMEWAGAFGDLGTLIPFVVAYLAMLDLDPLGVLLSFGVAMIVCGLVYRTPFPVQPMKAIGAIATTQAAQTLTVTAAAVQAATLATGAIWLALGVTGAAQRVARIVPRPVVVGVILGLGFGFMLTGARMMSSNAWIGAVGLVGTLLLLGNRRVPAMLLLLVFGVVCGIVADPSVVAKLSGIAVEPRAPVFALSAIGWNDLAIGVVFLALPQVPLTLGNAVIAITEENNREFPDRPVTETMVAVSTGCLNLGGAMLGGVPMCHGAGGMAGHLRFGARTGGAPIILGTILVVLALLFSGSVTLLLQLFPPAILGVILFLTGAQLALGACEFSNDKGERFATVITAALAAWNVGIAFVAGCLVWAIARRGWLKL